MRGTVEQTAKVRKRKRDLREGLLVTLQLAGALSVALVAPKLLRFYPKAQMSARFRVETKRALARLKKKGEIEITKEDGKTLIQLTERGEKSLALHSEKMKLSAHPAKKWDGSYRLVIFDLPEKRKRTRDLLRREMAEVGFLRLQDSVWIYPFSCEEYIALLKTDLRIGHEVLYAVVDSIENDSAIRKHFGLPDDT